MILGRVLITGATGFVGSHLTRRLVREGKDVHVLCREHSNFWRMRDILPYVTTHLADLRELPALRKVVLEVRPDHVFHLAAATVVAGASDAAGDLIGVNLLGTVHLIDACESIGYRSMVTTGDSFEYTPSKGRLSEDAPCHPTNLHGITKLAATLHAQAVAREKGRPIVTLRLFSTYGPADHPRRLIPRVIAGAVADTTLPLSSPEVARDWVYIDDLIDLYVEAAARADQLAGEVFNAGSGTLRSIEEVVATILRLTGSRSEAQWGTFEAPHHDQYPWVADPTRTFSRFAWRPRLSLEDGLARMIAAVRQEVVP